MKNAIVSKNMSGLRVTVRENRVYGHRRIIICPAEMCLEIEFSTSRMLIERSFLQPSWLPDYTNDDDDDANEDMNDGKGETFRDFSS